ncbi:MAG: type II toxin-antitoxin system VapC family toxin [Cyanobacteria bacterium K_Offshore_surface_m2_239]|nr:type II toxin-antitoxin system VapC family toxin [Cyanobacteria bacterium K_Offshore_surface_m2_239]
MILLDTHVLLWLDRDDPALGPTSRELIRAAWTNGAVMVCAISFWEVAMLAARGRVNLRQSPESWRLDWLQAGLEEIPLNGANAVAASALEAFHADPADRFIVATALATDATLLTADQAILGWSGPLRSQAASR